MQQSIIFSFLKQKQYLFSVSIVLLVSGICYLLSAYMGYKTVALILLLAVSIIAMFFKLTPVLVSAILSALIWNYFFIPPKFTLLINNTEDALMFVMYFAIALINATLTYKNKQWEKLAIEKDEKKNTLKLYNNVLNSLSHELRTPIATIIGATDNLLVTTQTLSEDDKFTLITEISKASLQLNGHVENLLNMSRIESGVIKPMKEWCDVTEMLYTIKHQLHDYSHKQNVQLLVQENLPLIKLDIGLIQQAIYNIVYNALLYTPNDSKIIITTVLTHHTLSIIIEDNGKGFPEKEIAQVFEKFYRLDDSKTGGTGLGLSITKGFIEAHGGTIQLENNKNKGAKFTITIPVEVSTINI